MSNATLAGIRRSNRELEAACRRAFAVFGDPIGLTCQSHNGRDFTSYEVYAADDVWAENAARAGVRIDYLTEYGRPKHITPQMWVWKSDFVRLSLDAHFPYNIYWHEPGCVDAETGKSVRKSGLRPFAMRVTVSGSRRIGLVDWAEKRDGLLAWAATFKCAEAGAAIKSGVEEADRNIADWKRGLAEIGASMAAIK